MSVRSELDRALRDQDDVERRLKRARDASTLSEAQDESGRAMRELDDAVRKNKAARSAAAQFND